MGEIVFPCVTEINVYKITQPFICLFIWASFQNIEKLNMTENTYLSINTFLPSW